ncbi:MAG: hypothetical protein K1X64_10830 [Myxococcaceae bacterium]|nr:hypothetical protein [Myxococcaceae bacterium]
MVINDIGQTNGVLKFWLDDVQTHDFNDITFIDAANPHGFYSRTWSPIYGGGCPNGDTKSRNDYLWIDHLYISGKVK